METNTKQNAFDITNNAIETVKINNLSDYNKILDFAEIWVKTQFREFTNETLKNCYYFCGNPEPVQPNVYGAVIRDLSRRKLIFEHGITKAKSEKAHSRILRTWISKEYRLKQQSNRKQDVSLELDFNQQSA